MEIKNNPRILASFIAESFNKVPQVSAVALGGSHAISFGTDESDLDLYVFITSPVPLAFREAIMNQRGAVRSNLDLNYWDLGDQWLDAQTGIELDIMYWDLNWIQDRINRTIIHHQASLGYSTCHWHTIKNSIILFDRQGTLALMKENCNQPYPEELRKAIIEKNYPVLRDVIPSYANQIQKAVRRKDLVSINHRVAAFLASYFDIIFAYNRVLHPGEKRLLNLIPSLCDQIPVDMIPQVNRLLGCSRMGGEDLMRSISDLVDNLSLMLK
jgi:hypothetical protein